MRVEPVTEADREAVAELLVNQMREHRVPASAEQLRDVVTGVLADSRYGFILVAKDAERVVGVAYAAIILSVEHGGRVAWLEELYVTPLSRGQGIGTALLTAVLAHARQSGLIAIDLEVDVEHQRAESLYRRLGFHGLPRARWAKVVGR
jgi:GNAT superfamily N-acetyltransferase